MTAEPVSWVAGKMTSQSNPTSCFTASVKPPRLDPGIETGPKIFAGAPTASSTSASHSSVRALSMPVVVAFVYSFTALPVSR